MSMDEQLAAYMQYVCPRCDAGFVTRVKLDDHLETHPKDERYCCPQCDKSYKTAYAFSHHILIHGHRYRCRLCTQRYGTVSLFEAHMRLHHGAEYNALAEPGDVVQFIEHFMADLPKPRPEKGHKTKDVEKCPVENVEAELDVTERIITDSEGKLVHEVLENGQLVSTLVIGEAGATDEDSTPPEDQDNSEEGHKMEGSSPRSDSPLEPGEIKCGRIGAMECNPLSIERMIMGNEAAAESDLANTPPIVPLANLPGFAVSGNVIVPIGTEAYSMLSQSAPLLSPEHLGLVNGVLGESLPEAEEAVLDLSQKSSMKDESEAVGSPEPPPEEPPELSDGGVNTETVADDVVFMYTCKICGGSFLFHQDISRHLMVHTSGEPFKCAICKQGYTSDRALDEHLREHSLGNGPYTCPLCNYNSARLYNLKRHLNTHNPEHTCSVCGVMVGDYSKLRWHMHEHMDKREVNVADTGSQIDADTIQRMLQEYRRLTATKQPWREHKDAALKVPMPHKRHGLLSKADGEPPPKKGVSDFTIAKIVEKQSHVPSSTAGKVPILSIPPVLCPSMNSALPALGKEPLEYASKDGPLSLDGNTDPTPQDHPKPSLEARSQSSSVLDHVSSVVRPWDACCQLRDTVTDIEAMRALYAAQASQLGVATCPLGSSSALRDQDVDSASGSPGRASSMSPPPKVSPCHSTSTADSAVCMEETKALDCSLGSTGSLSELDLSTGSSVKSEKMDGFNDNKDLTLDAFSQALTKVCANSNEDDISATPHSPDMSIQKASGLLENENKLYSSMFTHQLGSGTISREIERILNGKPYNNVEISQKISNKHVSGSSSDGVDFKTGPVPSFESEDIALDLVSKPVPCTNGARDLVSDRPDENGNLEGMPSENNMVAAPSIHPPATPSSDSLPSPSPLSLLPPGYVGLPPPSLFRQVLVPLSSGAQLMSVSPHGVLHPMSLPLGSPASSAACDKLAASTLPVLADLATLPSQAVWPEMVAAPSESPSQSQTAKPCKEPLEVSPTSQTAVLHPPSPLPDTDNIVCKKCLVTFPDLERLDAHMAKVHPRKMKMISCSQCRMKFRKEHHMLQHVARVHSTNEPPPARAKPLNCHLCAYSTSRNYNLQRHMKIHRSDAAPPVII